LIFAVAGRHSARDARDMPTRPLKSFRRGDRVSWNSEAGRVTGIIQRKVTRQIVFKGYKRHATPDAPQYIIKSDKSDHIAIHKGPALRRIAKKARGAR
jgi:hypothetical protein